MPAIQWWREDYEYRGGALKQILNNETFKIFEMGKNSALQVSECSAAAVAFSEDSAKGVLLFENFQLVEDKPCRI